MKMTIHSTDRIVNINGVPARIWEGETNTGITVYCAITRVAVKESEPEQIHRHFYQELTQVEPPSDAAIQCFPLRMILDAGSSSQ